MTTPERRLMAIRIVRLEQLLKEACDRIITPPHDGVMAPADVEFVEKARAALESTCMACGGAPCVCEKGAES